MDTMNTPTSIGCATLPALGMFADAFGAFVPTRGDLEGAVARRGHLPLLDNTVRNLVPVMVRGEPQAARNALEALHRQIDKYVTLSRRFPALHPVVEDLRTIALFAATRHAAQAVTDARQRGIVAPGAPLSYLPRLSVPAVTHWRPLLYPRAALMQHAPLVHHTSEMIADDWSPIGAAVAGYGAACACGYGSAMDTLAASDNALTSEETDEDATALQYLPQPTPIELEQAARIYPGAARALVQSFASRSPASAARAFGYLRRERVRNADILRVSLPNTEAKRFAARYMAAANALILHWAKKFHERHLEEKGRVAPAVAAQSVILRANAMNAASAVSRTEDDPHNRIEKITEEIVETAKLLGRARAANNHDNQRQHRDALEKLLARRQLLVVKAFDLLPGQTRDLQTLVSRVMKNLADIGSLTFHLHQAKDAASKAKLSARINANERDVSELRNKILIILRAAKRK